VRITLLFWDIRTSLALLIFSLFSFGVLIALFALAPIIIGLKSSLKKDERIIAELQETKYVYTEKEVENDQ
jgi:uncharacterized membrane protein